MATILSNAFSISMLSSNDSIVRIREIDVEKARDLVKSDFISAIGHASTSDLLSKLLGTTIPTNRISVKISKDDQLIVFQLLTRLPEGAVLTEAELSQLQYKFYTVEILPEETIEALYHW